MTRIIVAGSRSFNNKDFLYEKLDEVIFHNNDVLYDCADDIEIVHGNCRGADLLGEKYALDNGFKVIAFPAYWNKYGNKAGYLRNLQMAEYASKEKGILVAFPIGESKGTRMMIKLAKEHGLDVYVFE